MPLEHAVMSLSGRLGGGHVAIVAAVSGGADSMALLHALAGARDALNIKLLAAHFDHALREGSETEARPIAEFCAEREIPFRALREPVVAGKGESLEDAARRARYGFLRCVAESEGAGYVATAHHMDDQAETVLLHLLRGAGSAGLAGMREIAPYPIGGSDNAPVLLRPLLGVSRAEIEEYCSVNKIAYITDESNANTVFMRNRIRHLLMPVIRDDIGASSRTLARSAEILAVEDEFLSSLAEERLGTLLRDGALDIAAARALGQALARRVLRQFLCLNGTEASFYHIDKLISLANGQLDLPMGKWAYVEYGLLTIGEQKGQESAQTFCITPALPGETVLPCGFVAAVEAEKVEIPVPEFVAYLDMDATSKGVLRPREAGDKMRLLGASGSKRLKDILIDKKIPKIKRTMPVLAAGSDVLWMPGLPPSEHAKVKNDTERIIRLEYFSQENMEDNADV